MRHNYRASSLCLARFTTNIFVANPLTFEPAIDTEMGVTKVLNTIFCVLEILNLLHIHPGSGYQFRLDGRNMYIPQVQALERYVSTRWAQNEILLTCLTLRAMSINPNTESSETLRKERSSVRDFVWGNFGIWYCEFVLTLHAVMQLTCFVLQVRNDKLATVQIERNTFTKPRTNVPNMQFMNSILSSNSLYILPHSKRVDISRRSVHQELTRSPG